MKTFSGAKSKKLDRGAAMACVGMNLLATPGLGTMIAGRFVVGALQLLLAVVGFCLIIGWFYYLFQAAFEAAPVGRAWMWQSGLAIFAAGWLGALWSSLGIMRDAKTTTPPKLDGTPG
jgi:hypothetical protein